MMKSEMIVEFYGIFCEVSYHHFWSLGWIWEWKYDKLVMQSLHIVQLEMGTGNIAFHFNSAPTWSHFWIAIFFKANPEKVCQKWLELKFFPKMKICRENRDKAEFQLNFQLFQWFAVIFRNISFSSLDWNLRRRNFSDQRGRSAWRIINKARFLKSGMWYLEKCGKLEVTSRKTRE